MSCKTHFYSASELICRKIGEETFSQGEIDVLGGYEVLIHGRLTLTGLISPTEGFTGEANMKSTKKTIYS